MASWLDKCSRWTIIGAVLFVGVTILVLYPFFGPVRCYRDHMPSCMVNLMQLAQALKMYDMDYKAYPVTLGGYVKMDKEGKVIPFERAGCKSCLFPEYIRTVKGLHCSMSPFGRPDEVVEVRSGHKKLKYYAYDSYDVFTPEDETSVGSENLSYNPIFAAWSKGKPHIPDDTPVTWCEYHANGDPNEYVPVLYLSGSVEKRKLNDVRRLRWHLKPKTDY